MGQKGDVMNKHCHSCGMPVTEEVKGDYCLYCTDKGGNLHPREAVQQGIAQWLETFSPKENNPDFMERAGFYMRAMPAWADK